MKDFSGSGSSERLQTKQNSLQVFIILFCPQVRKPWVDGDRNAQMAKSAIKRPGNPDFQSEVKKVSGTNSEFGS